MGKRLKNDGGPKGGLLMSLAQGTTQCYLFLFIYLFLLNAIY